LQTFLDRHIVLTDLRASESELLNLLSENSSQLIPLEAAAAQLPAKVNALKEVDTKLDIAKTGKVKELAEFQIVVSAEKSLRGSLFEVKKMYELGLSLSKFRRDYDAMAKTAGALTADSTAVQAFGEARATIDSTNSYLIGEEEQINARLKESATRLDAALSAIAGVHSGFDAAIAARINELQKKGLSGSVQELNGFIRQRSLIANEIARVQAQAPQLLQLRDARKDLLQKLIDVRAEITGRRKAQVKGINSNLAQTIKDYTVAVYYDNRGSIGKFKEFVSETLHGTYFQDDSIAMLCSETTPEHLAALVSAADTAAIANLRGVASGKAWQVLERFRPLVVLHALEVMWKEPCPIIKVVTKGLRARQIPVTQLSDGQKHTILLTIAMLAESNLPLVIDQPEDDLDNAFIFSSIVATLRSIKERRQVILVTHNANIAVLGDSELILPMRRNGDNGEAFDRGAIDRAETRAAVQDILEGGALAFRKRQELYGY
jgi:hypothetical protein